MIYFQKEGVGLVKLIQNFIKLVHAFLRRYTTLKKLQVSSIKSHFWVKIGGWTFACIYTISFLHILP